MKGSLRLASNWRRKGTIALAAVASPALALYAAIRLVPLPADLLRPCPGTTTLVDCKGRKLCALPGKTARAQEPIPLSQMGLLPAITVALEDARFYRHHGIDLRAAAAALAANVRAGRIVRGGSTITQQLIKMSSGRTRQSWRAKLYENLAALRLEREWTKERILEEYLNRSDYGNRRIGAAAAARAYFGQPPSRLTLAQAIYLVGLPRAPTRFNPWRRPAMAQAKFARSLTRLGELNFPSRNSLGEVLSPPHLIARAPETRIAPHFVQAVLNGHRSLPPGTVRTTLDLDLQRFVEGKLAMHLQQLASRRVRHGAVIVLDAATGAVRAMVGSPDFRSPDAGQINGTTAYRSCGSTLKPFLYLHAIDQRLLTAATLLPDTPDAVRAEYIDYDPVNYDRRFLGPVRVREALASSLNVPAVVALSRVGARKTFGLLQTDGLRFPRTFRDYGAGLILGNAEIRLLDLASAFSVFSGQGGSAAPHFLAGENSRHRSVASPESVAIVSDILSDNEARRSTFGPFSPLAFSDAHIPCKTGTSSGFRDTWAVGATEQHVVAVWVGNFDGAPMDEIASVTGAAPVWRSVIDYLLERKDSSVPPPREGPRLTRRAVCATTGALPSSHSEKIVEEWFLPGSEPTESADRYWHVIGGRPRLVLPPEYAQWCRSPFNHLSALFSSGAPIRIVSPAPNTHYIIDPNLSRAQQAVRLEAVGDFGEPVDWRVDGEPVKPVSGNYLWTLLPGAHSVEVLTSAGRTEASFSVE